jgi:hypothetical protein
MQQPFNTQNQQTTELQKAFGFTEQDLQENRRGQLSGPQIATLRQGASRTATAILAVLGIIGGLVLFTANIPQNELGVLMLCLVTPALIALAATVGAVENAVGPRLVSKRSGQIHLRYGMMSYNPPVDLSTPVHRVGFAANNGSYFMLIGDTEFVISKDQYEALAIGLYTVYFIPTLRRVVSVELIEVSATQSVPEPAEMLPTAPVAPNYSVLDDEGEDPIRA